MVTRTQKKQLYLKVHLTLEVRELNGTFPHTEAKDISEYFPSATAITPEIEYCYNEMNTNSTSYLSGGPTEIIRLNLYPAPIE